MELGTIVNRVTRSKLSSVVRLQSSRVGLRRGRALVLWGKQSLDLYAGRVFVIVRASDVELRPGRDELGKHGVYLAV